MRFRFSSHAIDEMQRRGIPEAYLQSVLDSPEQVTTEHGGRKAYQSRIDFGHGRVFLVRAIVDDRVDPAVVVTVYRTSKVSKYWREE